MHISSFFNLVEIRTKVASVIPYFLGTLYVVFAFDTFKPLNALLMFLSIFIFDMATTAINNYMDFSKAIKKDGYGYENHNAIVHHNLNPKTVRFTIYGMVFTASILGFILFLRTDWIVLLLGCLSFAIGILYSFGPIPISRTPFGELFSGLTMGFLIPFIAIYIHLFDQDLINIGVMGEYLNIKMNFGILFSLFIITIPLITGISNIMLANNICDIEDDIHNKRYTLPIYIGKDYALLLFKWLYYIGFLAIILGVVMGILPFTSLFTLIALVPITKHLKLFQKHQSKKDTFILAVKNFVLLNTLYIVTILLGILLKLIF